MYKKGVANATVQTQPVHGTGWAGWVNDRSQGCGVPQAKHPDQNETTGNYSQERLGAAQDSEDWERRTENTEDWSFPITTYDIVFVVLGLVTEFCVMLQLMKSWWPKSDVDRLSNMCFIFFLFFTDVAFSVGKLFPGVKYYCETSGCAKVTHNCVMTLSAFVFSVFEHIAVHRMITEGGSTGVTKLKLVEWALNASYVIYDSVTEDMYGPGTLVLVVMACGAEFVLMNLEMFTMSESRIWITLGIGAPCFGVLLAGGWAIMVTADGWIKGADSETFG